MSVILGLRNFYCKCSVRLLSCPKNSSLKNRYLPWIHSSVRLNVRGLPVNMPSLSPTMIEGSIVKWLKKEGDIVQPGDILCDIQTDKAVVSLETEDEGILAKILVQEDSSDIKVGTLIALMVGEGEDWKTVEIPETTEADTIDTATEVSAQKSSLKLREEHYGPSVRLLLEKYGLYSDEVMPGGPHGILLKGDVLKYVKVKKLQPKQIIVESAPVTDSLLSFPLSQGDIEATKSTKVISGAHYDDVMPTSMRRTIAKRLVQSKFTIAHAYCSTECNIDELQKFKNGLKKEGMEISINDLIIKSVGAALERRPDVNCVWDDGQLIYKDQVDISVAVATDTGLMTPIVRHVDRLGLEEIATTVKELASRARRNALQLDEINGGSLTISNLGMLNIKEFRAIINPPQCAILAVGEGVMELGTDGKVEQHLRVSLSYDLSAISDNSAALFLKSLKEILHEPRLLLLRPSSVDTVHHPLAALI